MSNDRQDLRLIVAACAACALAQIPEALESWRRTALRSKAARRAWLKAFGVAPEDVEPQPDALPARRTRAQVGKHTQGQGEGESAGTRRNRTR